MRAHFILVGLLYLCRVSISQECRTKLRENMNYVGSYITSLYSPDVEHCQQLCTQHPSCLFFTFDQSGRNKYKCQLKFSWTVPRIARLEAKAGLVSGFSHKIQISQQYDTACPTTLFLNTDIPGNEMDNLPAASLEHCHTLCTAHPQCTCFSYTSDNFMCYLKNNSNEMVVQAKESFTSGIPARSCQLDNNWVKKHHAGVDFWGSDFRNLWADDAEACQRSCTEDPNCQFFTYVDESFPLPPHRHICYLKRVIAMPAPPKVTKLADVVSGFSLKNCVNSVLQTLSETETELP